jgi:flagellar basal-body rod protein FlgB
MNDISDQSIMAALGRRLTMAVEKQAVTAGNLANLNTPGYRTREASFDDVLTNQVRGAESAVRTHPGHLASGDDGVGADHAREVEGLPARRDGNNVELDRELLQMSRAAGDFTAAQTAMAAKFRLVRYALNEGGR